MCCCCSVLSMVLVNVPARVPLKSRSLSQYPCPSCAKCLRFKPWGRFIIYLIPSCCGFLCIFVCKFVTIHPFMCWYLSQRNVRSLCAESAVTCSISRIMYCQLCLSGRRSDLIALWLSVKIVVLPCRECGGWIRIKL